MSSPKVLSVQSHVVHGYVGNRAAVFPLQLLGFEVDVINSVQFSCHTGYPKLAGQRVSGDELREVVEGLRVNECLDHSFLLTGYIGAVSFLREVMHLRSLLPETCCYVCDPVLGDNGQLYVPEELVAVYRSDMLQHVSILTPNQFEAEQLTEKKITSIQEAVAACDLLHSKGPKVVVLTTLDVIEATKEGEFVAMLLSEGQRKWLLRVPFVKGGPFTGTGDLTAAMILAWTHMVPQELPLALEKAAAVLQGVLRQTVEVSSARRIGTRWVAPELRLVQSQEMIRSPEIRHRCQLVETLDIQGVVLEHGEPDLLKALRATSLKVGLLKSEGDLAGGSVMEHLQRWALQPQQVLVVNLPAPEGCVTVAWRGPNGNGYCNGAPTSKEADFRISSWQSLSRFLPI